MHHDMYQFESLLNASSHQSLEKGLVDLTDRLGYDFLFYSPLISLDTAPNFHDEKLVEAARLPTKNIFTTYPESWIVRYQEADFVKSDPVVKAGLETNLPIVWRNLASKKERHPVFDEARQHGLGNGISIPIHRANGEKALLSVSSSDAPEKREAHESQILGQIFLAAFYLNEAVNLLNALSGQHDAPPQLSLREKECLLWASAGKTSWEIGKILKISEHTVIFHIRNARKKLGATNRQQAIASAISHKIILP